jgi:hypothetical protein
MTVGRHDANKEDNVLVEWIMSLEMLKVVKGIRILPIFAGSQTDDKISNLFADETAADASGRRQVPFLDTISRDVPVASLSIAKRLLQENSIPFDDARISSYTVKGIVDEISKMLGCKSWEIKPDELSVAISELVRGVVVQCVAAEEATAAIRSSSSVFINNNTSSSSSSSAPIVSLKGMSDYIAAALEINSVGLGISQVIEQAVDILGVGNKPLFTDPASSFKIKLEALMKFVQ